jgi:hypothetical protein
MHHRPSFTVLGSALLLAFHCAFGQTAESITISLDGAKGACKEISLPKWPPPISPLPPNVDWQLLVLSPPATSDLGFREAQGGGLLVSLFVTFPGILRDLPPMYSRARYRIDLGTGRAQAASESEWGSAKPYSTLRSSTRRAGIVTKPEDHLVYKGRDFSRRGTHWPLLSESAARLSPDGALLAVYGWDGVITRGPKDGNYYVDIYRTADGTLAMSLNGHFQGVDPYLSFWVSAWISKSYYVLPLDTENMNRFVLCDVQAAANAK